MNKKSKLLDNLVNCMVETLVRLRSGGGFDKWPLPKYNLHECEIYSQPYLIRYFLDYTSQLEKKGYSDKDIAQLFKYPSIIARLIFMFRYKHLLKASSQEQVEAALKIAKYLLSLQKDAFYVGKNRKNILWDRKQLKNQLQKIHFINLLENSKKEEYYKLISQIDGKLFLYTELVYSDYHNLGHEFHGPYNLDKEKLIVKEYHDLKPGCWKFTKSFPFDKITIYEVYQKGDVKVNIDIHNRMLTSKPIVWQITKFFLEADGKEMRALEDLEKISKELDKTLKRGIKEKSSLRKWEIITKLAEKSFYLIKPLAKELKKDWRPPKIVYHKIYKLFLSKEEKKLLKIISKLGGDRRSYRIKFDPRIFIKASQK